MRRTCAGMCSGTVFENERACSFGYARIFSAGCAAVMMVSMESLCVVIQSLQ